MQQAATNIPRFQYSTASNQLGLYIEQTRTNLMLYCRDFSNAAWVKTNGTAALNQIGLDGQNNSASLLTATSANATFLQTITGASVERNLSFYIKRITGTGNIQITQDGGSTWTTVTITSAFTLMTTLVQTVLNPVVGIRLVTSGDVIVVDCGIFETRIGSSTSTVGSPIITTSAAVTVGADQTTFNNYIYAPSYSAFCEFELITQAGYYHLYNICNGSTWTNSSMFFLSSVTHRIYVEYLNSSSTKISTIAIGTISRNTLQKMYISITNNNTKSARNGITFANGAIASGINPPKELMDKILLGRSTTYSNTHLNKLLYKLKMYSAPINLESETI